jgi:hypothetical protein
MAREKEGRYMGSKKITLGELRKAIGDSLKHCSEKEQVAQLCLYEEFWRLGELDKQIPRWKKLPSGEKMIVKRFSGKHPRP